MKHVILLGDGMADYPIPSLGGKTPLEFANTPNMDRIASEGTLGLIDTIPKGLSPGSDVANLAVLGYDPGNSYSGRGPLEAASMDVQMGPDDVAFRCNLVTTDESNNPRMLDFTSGHINSDEAKEIVYGLHKELGSEDFAFYPGVSYRHLLLWKNGISSMETIPPHDITGRGINDFLPKGEGARQLNDLMRRAQKVLQNHPINLRRIKEGKKPANFIWLWGQGRAPKFTTLTEKYNLRGGMISAVDLLNGIGVYAGLKVIHVDGATGYTDTNYIGKAKKAIDALQELDFIFLHVESPDEMGHEGDIEGKIRAIEDFDKMVVGTILEDIQKFSSFRVMVLSDHPTPVTTMTHSSAPSPFAVYSSRRNENLSRGGLFGETSAKKAGILVSPGYRLMDYFIGDWRGFVEEKSH
ncbi:MAG: cofactor-independent phosphoglycerate mutase [Syntrophales bacterium]|nr:cofactor-independent phosphoglycerate mutase [Syntrophales bacterium]